MVFWLITTVSIVRITILIYNLCCLSKYLRIFLMELWKSYLWDLVAVTPFCQHDLHVIFDFELYGKLTNCCECYKKNYFNKQFET